jgi:hypothetical protein
MKHLVLTAALAAATLLSGCSSVSSFLTSPQAANSPGLAILSHLEGCKRTYRGALGTGVTGSFEIECPVSAPAAAPSPADPPQ